MKLEAFEESSERDKCGHLGGFVMTCPICGKEFVINSGPIQKKKGDGVC